MKRIRRVLVGTDFMPGAMRAARRALSLPLAPGAAVTLVHVAPPMAAQAFEATVKAAALAALDRQRAGLARPAAGRSSRIRTALVTGAAPAALAREAKARGAELVVAGPHGSRGLPDLDLGSTTERLLAESQAPVLIARLASIRPYRRVVVAFDPGGSSHAALALAMRLVADGGRITLLHAVELPVEAGIRLSGTSVTALSRWRAQARDETARVLEAETAAVERSGLAADWTMSDGDARSVILAAARDLRADLVALGTRRVRERTGLLIGSVARWVARRAACDVLVVRTTAARR